MAVTCRTLQEAAELLRYCLESSEVVLSKHFRDELINDHLDMEDALTSASLFDHSLVG